MNEESIKAYIRFQSYSLSRRFIERCNLTLFLNVRTNKRKSVVFQGTRSGPFQAVSPETKRLKIVQLCVVVCHSARVGILILATLL